MTSLSANGSTEDLVDAAEQMKKLNLATDRSAVSHNSTVSSRLDQDGLYQDEHNLTGNVERCLDIRPQIPRYQD